LLFNADMTDDTHQLVGRVAPCAPSDGRSVGGGAHGVTRPTCLRKALGFLFFAVLASTGVAAVDPARHPVPRTHPRLFGSREDLSALARQRPAEYQRMVGVAGNEKADDYSWIISASLVSAIQGDQALAQKVHQRAMKYVNGPIRVGHVTFGTDLVLCGIAYDLCHAAWPEADQRTFHDYVNKTVEANAQSETHVFHNAYYGYKNWGIGVACYACYYENERAPATLRALEEDYRKRAAPALEMAGAGGGWAEGYYIHYWLYEWLFFCEVARRCEGADYYALAPAFFRNRAVASMFETFPGLREYHSRRCVPMGDGGGANFGGDRDKTLAARRILANYYHDDPAHQVVHTFDEITPRCAVGEFAYKDFLWHDTHLPGADLKSFKLSHYSPGPGFVYARSSWEDDATYFFFKCGDRFTAHQHLDVNHFIIYKHEELAGDGGHYDDFGTAHDVNYHLRSIAHNTVLVLDPAERWRENIRAGRVTGNDGGQNYPWPHHNGAMADVADWEKQRSLGDIADMLAFEDRGDYLYVAGDATRAYSARKLELFTRQIVYVRPNTFVIFDQVKSKQADFKKTWLLQAMHRPERSGEQLVITNGKGRLFVQTLLPQQPQVRLASGADLYRYDGQEFPPSRARGAAPECRVEISPSQPNLEDFFLHVLTTGDERTTSVPVARVDLRDQRLQVTVGGVEIGFERTGIGGQITLNGKQTPLGGKIQSSAGRAP
jgi:hypothetical protein